MLRLIGVIGICLSTLLVFCQTPPKYQVATITGVKPHQAASDTTSDVVSYDVCVKVADTIYVVLYTPPLGMNTVKYAAGRDLLVLVGKDTISYNDLLGQSFEAPIISRKAVTPAKQPR